MKILSNNNTNNNTHCSTKKYSKYTKYIALCIISSLCFACGVRGDLVPKTAINQSLTAISPQIISK